MEQQNPLSYCLRWLGWGICNSLAGLTDGLQNTVNDINSIMGGFFTSPGVTALSNKVLPIAIALIGILIVYIGIAFIVKPQQGTAFIGNFIVGLVVAISLPFFLTKAYSLTDSAIKYLNSDSAENPVSLSSTILAQGITDTLLYDATDFESTNLKYQNYFLQSALDDVKNIDPTQLVLPGDTKHKDVWENGFTTDSTGTDKLTKLSDGKLGWIDVPIMSSYYYRWNIDWFTILVTLSVTLFALIFSGIRIARLLFELAFHQILAQIMGLLDFYSGQRLRKCIEMIISTLATLFACTFMLQLYVLGTTFISQKVTDNPVLKIILLVALAWAVIDGPDLFERIFGIDAGIKSGFRTILGVKAVVGSAKAVGSQAWSMTKGAVGLGMSAKKGISDRIHKNAPNPDTKAAAKSDAHKRITDPKNPDIPSANTAGISSKDGETIESPQNVHVSESTKYPFPRQSAATAKPAAVPRSPTASSGTHPVSAAVFPQSQRKSYPVGKPNHSPPISIVEAFKQALLEKIEDEYDIAIANQSYAEYI
ncbi:MAG: DUF6290 family protein, partial [Oscillospiraceae bacterium]